MVQNYQNRDIRQYSDNRHSGITGVRSGRRRNRRLRNRSSRSFREFLSITRWGAGQSRIRLL